MKDKRPDIVRILVKASKEKNLVDQRLRRNFAVFGNIMDVARQYGIKHHPSQETNKLEFSAPKDRMQLFIEKLHFSEVRYSEKKI